MLVSATALLRANPDPTEEEIRIGLSGNLCRCTGYDGIVRAVRQAASGDVPPLGARAGPRGRDAPAPRRLTRRPNGIGNAPFVSQDDGKRYVRDEAERKAVTRGLSYAGPERGSYVAG